MKTIRTNHPITAKSETSGISEVPSKRIVKIAIAAIKDAPTIIIFAPEPQAVNFFIGYFVSKRVDFETDYL